MRTLHASLLLLATSLQAQQWQDISPDINSELEAVLVDDAQHFMISGDASYRTSDGGATWVSIPGLDEGVRAFLRLDASTILGAGEGVVMRSIDNGDNWSTVSTPATDDLHALAHRGDTVIAVGRDGNILRSNDAGLNWSAQNSGTAERLFTVAMRSATEFLVGGRGGIFLATTDGGTTWTPRTLPASDDWVDLHFFNELPDTGLLLGEGGTILRTTDGGATWNEVVGAVNGELGGLASANDSVVYASSTQGRVWKSSDQGVSWTVTTSPLNEFLTNIAAGGEQVVAVGEQGGAIKLAANIVGLEEHRTHPFTLAPNPATDRIEVLGAALGARCVVQVLAADGRLMTEAPFARILDVNTLAPGAYLLRIIEGTEVRGQERFVVRR